MGGNGLILSKISKRNIRNKKFAYPYSGGLCLIIFNDFSHNVTCCINETTADG